MDFARKARKSKLYFLLAKFATAPTPHSELRPKAPKRKNRNSDVAAIIIINLFIIYDIISIISDIYILPIAYCQMPIACCCGLDVVLQAPAGGCANG